MEEVGPIEASLAKLGIAGAKAIDGLIDADSLAVALDQLDDGGELVVRVMLEQGEAAEGFGQEPKTPAWARLKKRSTMLGIAMAVDERFHDVAVNRVHVERKSLKCCDAPSCTIERAVISTWLDLSGEGAPARLLVAERRVSSETKNDPAGIAARLARLLDVPLEGADGERVEIATSDGSSLTAKQLARFALREEGERLVLRDHASHGPRANAARNSFLGVLQLLVAFAAWAELALAIHAGDHGVAIAAGAAAALFTLSGYAFIGVARYSARYAASSNPCVVLGNDKLVVAPWVSRSGAIDLRPEGRLGAAIPLHEVRSASVKPRGPLLAVEIDTDHGPMDAIAVRDAAVAGFWADAITRAIEATRHPKEGATARQRARAKAQSSPTP